MKCPRCTESIGDLRNFCTHCGMDLRAARASSQRSETLCPQEVKKFQSPGSSTCSASDEITIPLRKPKEKRKCIPLLPVGCGEFILCKEGVYTTDFDSVGPLGPWPPPFDFYSWDSLAVFRADEKKRVIGLKVVGKRRLLKLRARKENFNELKTIIKRCVTAEAQLGKTDKPAFRIGLLGALMCILLLAQIGAARFYEHLSSGSVGDQHCCDVCGGITDTGGTLQWIEITRGEQVVHEYCLVHGFIYELIHPVDDITGLAQRGFKEGVASAFAVVALLVWGILLSLAVWISLPQWYKTKMMD